MCVCAVFSDVACSSSSSRTISIFSSSLRLLAQCIFRSIKEFFFVNNQITTAYNRNLMIEWEKIARNSMVHRFEQKCEQFTIWTLRINTMESAIFTQENEMVPRFTCTLYMSASFFIFFFFASFILLIFHNCSKCYCFSAAGLLNIYWWT